MEQLTGSFSDLQKTCGIGLAGSTERIMHIISSRKTLSAAWPALLLASLILLPWLNKAHTVDDTTFLLMAEHVLKDPLHPTAFEMVADGNRIRLSSQLVSGPLMAYLLVPSVLLGGAEWAAHLVQYLLMLAAILATVSLAFRLGLDPRGARISGLLLASTPAVMVMATTSMADVPAMAFAALGMERFMAWRQERRGHRCFTSAIFFAVAALSRPHMILILPIAGVFAFLFNLDSHEGRLSRAAVCAKRALLRLSPIFVASALIIVVTLLTADPIHPGGHFATATLARFRPVNIASNMAAFFIHWVLVFPLAFLWICRGLRWKRLWRNPAPWLAALMPLLIWMLDRKEHKVPAFALALAFIGTLVLLDILVDVWRRRDRIQFSLWVWLLIALPAIAYVQLPCRYLIGSAPAVAILLGLLVQRTSKLGFVRWIAISAGIVLALLIIAADNEFASFGRRIAAEQISPRVAKGDRVWVNGEWGFEWYAIKAGAIPVAKQPPYPGTGDILVSSSATPHIPLDLFPTRQLIGSVTATSHYGCIMSPPAGFYSNGYGYLPWIRFNGHREQLNIFVAQRDSFDAQFLRDNPK